MTTKRKICVLVTARPSYSRIKSALRAIADHPDLELQLVVAASALLDRYGSAIHSIEHDGFDIAARVYMVLEGENLVTSAKSTGLGLVELATVFDNLKPDIVVTVADRYETLATAVAASYMNIPVAHVQGGEVTGSIDEKVRHAVTKLANLHFVSTSRAAERVIRLGEEPESVFLTGCPSVDLAASIREDPRLDFNPIARYGGVGSDLDLSNGYLVVMQHPVTTEYQEARNQMLETLHAIQDIAIPTLLFWPNVDAGSDGTSKAIRVFRENEQADNVHLFRNMLPEDFLRLAFNATCIVGNSSVAIRECSFLGVPAVNIGSRQSGRERGPNVIDVEHDRRAIAEAVRRHALQGRPAPDTLYGDGRAGPRIADHLAEQDLRIDKRLTVLDAMKMSATTMSDRAERIAALEFDYVAEEKRTVNRCNLCGGDGFIGLTHRDRYGFSAEAHGCRRCGLVFLNPVMSPDRYRDFYIDTYRPLVSAFHGRLIDAHTIQAEQRDYARERAAVLAPFVDPRRHRTLLDIGGSTGVVAAHFAERFGLSATVLDPAPLEIAEAQKLGLETVSGFVEEFDPAERQFDVVTMCQTIDHLLDVSSALRAIRSLIAPDGVLFVDIVDLRAGYLRNWSIEDTIKIDHPFYLTEATAEAFLRRAGFAIGRIDYAADHLHVGYVCRPSEPDPSFMPSPDAVAGQWHEIRFVQNAPRPR